MHVPLIICNPLKARRSHVLRENFRLMNIPRQEFLFAIRPLSIGLQILGCFLAVIAWATSSPEYHYNKTTLASLVIVLCVTIPLATRLRFLVAASTFNIWIIAAFFLLIISPSPNRNFWAFSLTITFALVIAPLYEKASTYIVANCGAGIILGAGKLSTPPSPGDTDWFVLMTISIIFLGCVLNSFFSRLHIKNIQLRHELEDLAYRDALTGIGNRRKLIRDIASAAASRDMKHCCFLMIDVDGFKQINDQYGHDQGDMVLEQVGNMLAKVLSADHAGRMGGEEFGVLTLSGGEARAIDLARLILEQTRNIRVGGHPVTVSIGIASADATFTDMVRNADDALYQAKRSGKDRFVLHRQTDDIETPAQLNPSPEGSAAASLP